MRSRFAAYVLDVLIIASAALLLLIASMGGVDYEWGAIRVRAHAASRPLILLIGSLAARIWLFGASAEYAATRGLLALLLAIAATYGHHHVRACGGADSYGYVSASSLIASGRLHEDQPLAAFLPFPEAPRAAAPLGWVVGADAHSRVPRYPLGLPLVMALFRVFGADGPFFVPLVLAYGTLAIVFLAGRDVASPLAGLFAATLVAVDPVFVDLAIQPMSDVPATFWLVTAAWLALVRSRWPIVAGMSAGMALLTRPVLLPAVLVMVLLSRSNSEYGMRNAESIPHSAFRIPHFEAWFAGTVATFVIAQMVLNQALYGSPFASGYGEASHLFQASRLTTNLWGYPKWLTYVHTPALWVAWIAGLVVLRDRRWSWQFSLIAVAVALPYLSYIVYDDWESLRFVLPGIVLVLVVSGVGFHKLLASVRRPAYRSLVLFAVALVCAYASWEFLERHRAFDLKRAEAKYPMVGGWLREHTPERAVILAALHSGSIRYYGARETIRWDEIPAGMLAETVKRLRAEGYVTYVALDVPSEAKPFDARLERERGQIVMVPAGRVREVNIWELR